MCKGSNGSANVSLRILTTLTYYFEKLLILEIIYFFERLDKELIT